jgi:hypothetical protein
VLEPWQAPWAVQACNLFGVAEVLVEWVPQEQGCPLLFLKREEQPKSHMGHHPKEGTPEDKQPSHQCDFLPIHTFNIYAYF